MRKARSYEASDGKGLECPACGCRHFTTSYTRARDFGIRRGKTCRNCGGNVLTREVIDETK
jgi:DNA-directed RNA polymerase subunit RPC12/RpoP